MLTAILSAFYYNIETLKVKGDHKETLATRLILYGALVIPPILISLLVEPRDLFAEINMFPEVISRVSCV